MPVAYRSVNTMVAGLPTRKATLGLDQVILQNVGKFWVSGRDLYDRVVGDWGSLNRRTFYRHMARLRDRGIVESHLDYGWFWYRRRDN